MLSGNEEHWPVVGELGEVYVWLYVCMAVCMYVWRYVCVAVCMYGCMYVWLYVCMNLCMCDCVRMLGYVCKRIRMLVCMRLVSHNASVHFISVKEIKSDPPYPCATWKPLSFFSWISNQSTSPGLSDGWPITVTPTGGDDTTSLPGSGAGRVEGEFADERGRRERRNKIALT